MHDLGGGRDRRPVAGLPGAQRQVGVLAVHEEAVVEAAELRPGGGGDRQQAAGDDAHLADRVPVPAAQRLGIESGGGR